MLASSLQASQNSSTLPGVIGSEKTFFSALQQASEMPVKRTHTSVEGAAHWSPGAGVGAGDGEPPSSLQPSRLTAMAASAAPTTAAARTMAWSSEQPGGKERSGGAAAWGRAREAL